MIISTSQFLILSLLALTLGLFIWGRWRHDLVAFFSLVLATIIGLVEPNDIFSGFGHPATLTVAFVLILSFGLSKSGVTNIISQAISPMSQWPSLQIATIVGMGAAMSAFLNNVGVLALLMPVAIQSAIRGKYSPSLILMPLSFGTLLGGMVTMIGTPPNIVMASYREQVMGAPFGMFDFTPVGAFVAAIGVLFLAIIGWRFLGKREAAVSEAEDLFEIKSYMTEVKIQEKSRLLHKTMEEVDKLNKDLDLIVLGLIRDGRKVNNPRKSETLFVDDILLIEASPKDTELFATRNQVIVGQDEDALPTFDPKQDDWIEAVVAPNSVLDGRVVEQINLKGRYGINLLAIARQGSPYRGRLKSFKLRVGDVLLLRGDSEALKELISNMKLLPLIQRGLEIGKQQQPMLAVAIFASAIAMTSMGILPFHLSFGVAVLAMTFLGIIPVRQLYDGIDWPVIVLLASMIPVGQAFETTGATQLVVSGFTSLTHGAEPVVVLTLLLITTMALTDVLNNVATVVLMAPIAKQIADSISANPDPFFMTVAVGASCAFLTPIGHQNNALIMGPGKYKFGDYWRMGLPLDIVIIAMAIPTIMHFWPL